ncbi:MAG: copper amine oxidase N-terminal domain-containing protein [Oscillospiraceae bacterium]|jgi:hypothetical protein|nr:copper amine oxidase N-terminal domain-containing protein [Oscillospiraceae bacterium]
MQKKLKPEYFLISAVIALTVLFTVLQFFIRMARDDYMYASYSLHGLRGFVSGFIEQYKTNNGRVFVHSILSPLLQLKQIPFQIFNSLLFIALLFTASRLCTDPAEIHNKRSRLLACLFVAACVPLIGINILLDSVFWGSGSLNYLFPSVLFLVFLCLLQKSKPNFWLLLIVSFYCGLTTEMMGLLPVVAIWYDFFTSKSRITPLRRAIISLAAIVAWLTIMLAPGVINRRYSFYGSSAPFYEQAVINLSHFSQIIFEPKSMGLLLSVIMAAIGLSSGKKALRITAFAASVPMLISWFVPIVDNYWRIALMLAAFGVICVHAVILFLRRDFLPPLFFLCALFLSAVALVAPAIFARIMFPVMLMLLIYGACVVVRLEFRFTAAAVGALAVAGGITLVVFISGFAQNAAITDKNNRTTDGHVQPLANIEFSCDTEPMFGSETWRERYGIPPELEITIDWNLTSVSYKDTFISDEAMIYHGVVYVPLGQVTRAFGYKLLWQCNTAVLISENRTLFFVQNSRTAAIDYRFGRALLLDYAVLYYNSRNYVAEADLQKILDLAAL